MHMLVQADAISFCQYPPVSEASSATTYKKAKEHLATPEAYAPILYLRTNLTANNMAIDRRCIMELRRVGTKRQAHQDVAPTPLLGQDNT